MTIVSVPRSRACLIDRIVPRSAAGDTVLVGGGAALTAIAAQVLVPLHPVPFTLQTFSVLVVGLALGSFRGAVSMIVYILAGALGVPLFSSASSGVDIVLGATGGYLVGFVVAAWLVGRVAERAAGRVLPTVTALAAGWAAVYAVGVPWLSISLGVGLGDAVNAGFLPFLAGDAIKLAAVAALVPVLTAPVTRNTREDER